MKEFAAIFNLPQQSRKTFIEEINRALWNFSIGKLEQINKLVINRGGEKKRQFKGH